MSAYRKSVGASSAGVDGTKPAAADDTPKLVVLRQTSWSSRLCHITRNHNSISDTPVARTFHANLHATQVCKKFLLEY